MTAFGDAFKSARAGGAKTFTFGGKSYSTARADDKPGRGTDPDYGRDTKVTKNNLAAANASSDPIAALNSQKRWTGPGSDRRDDEAGMSRGTRPSAGAGRGGQGGKSMSDVVNAPAKYNAGAGRGAQGTAAEGYKNGGMVKTTKSSTKRTWG
jgi:hypothetical protein